MKIVESTIKNCGTWDLFRQLRLSRNMRAVSSSQEQVDWLIQIGNGNLPMIPGLSPTTIEIPSEFLLKDLDISLQKC